MPKVVIEKIETDIVDHQNEEVVNSIEISLLEEKKKLIEQTQRINAVNSANKLKISNLEENIDKLTNNLETITEIEEEVKTIIDTHKKTLMNPEKTAEKIQSLENEISNLEEKINTVSSKCIQNMQEYSGYLARFL